MGKINDTNLNLHKILIRKVHNFIKENKDNIKNYFQLNGTISNIYNNNNSSLLKDKQILYIRNPTEQNNFYLEIYNISAAFRFDNGFFQLINQLNIIFSIFSNKYKDEEIEEKKRLFASLFESIEEQDTEKIDEIIGFSFDEDQLYNIKSGLDKLVNYFGLENIQIYYESKVNIMSKSLAKTTTTLSGIVSGVVSSIFEGTVFLGSGVGLGVDIIVGIVSLIFMEWNKPHPQRIEIQNGIDSIKVRNNINKIEDLLYQIKRFYTNNYNKYVNVIIFAIDKSKENNNDFIIYGENLIYLNIMDSPTLEDSREYYHICFELIHRFVNKYEYLVINNRVNLEKEIKNDFEILKYKKTLPELKNLLYKLKSEDKKRLKNLESSSNSLNLFSIFNK